MIIYAVFCCVKVESGSSTTPYAVELIVRVTANPQTGLVARLKVVQTFRLVP